MYAFNIFVRHILRIQNKYKESPITGLPYLLCFIYNHFVSLSGDGCDLSPWHMIGGFPHDILPSGHLPLVIHSGPACWNINGDTSIHKCHISIATARISHWARLQHLCLKKLNRERTFIVTMIYVSHALGRRMNGDNHIYFEYDSFPFQTLF